MSSTCEQGLLYVNSELGKHMDTAGIESLTCNYKCSGIVIRSGERHFDVYCIDLVLKSSKLMPLIA